MVACARRVADVLGAAGGVVLATSAVGGVALERMQTRCSQLDVGSSSSVSHDRRRRLYDCRRRRLRRRRRRDARRRDVRAPPRCVRSAPWTEQPSARELLVLRPPRGCRCFSSRAIARHDHGPSLTVPPRGRAADSCALSNGAAAAPSHMSTNRTGARSPVPSTCRGASVIPSETRPTSRPRHPRFALPSALDLTRQVQRARVPRPR